MTKEVQVGLNRGVGDLEEGVGCCGLMRSEATKQERV